MHGRIPRLTVIVIILTVAALLFAGCGGGGGGGGGGDDDGGNEPTPPPPPPPSDVEIGPGPGPEADAIPDEPAISTVAARACPFADAPDAALVRQAAIDRIDAFASEPPGTEDELRAVLTDFTAWVSEEPNDAVSQAGLATAIVVVGAYNAGIDAGYAPGQVLSLLSPVTEVASAGLREDRESPSLGIIPAAADFPDPTDPDFSSADLQIGIRRFLLPALRHARGRVEAVATNAPGPNVCLAAFPSRHGRHYAYRAEFRALNGLFRIGQSLLLQFCAYQFNPGDWDWTAPLADRDEDGDGLLQVDEYLPGDPFLWRHEANNMQLGGWHLRRGLEMLTAAIERAHDDSMIAQALRPDGPSAALETLGDLQEMLEGEVGVRIVYEGGLGGAGSFTARMDLSRLWSAPRDDLKTLFPTLRPVSQGYWEALPRGRSDFPEPTLGGVFPRPDPVLTMLATGPTYIAITHGSVERLTVIDRRDEAQ